MSDKTTTGWTSKVVFVDQPEITIIDLGSRPCGKHGSAYSDHCDECSHSRFPIPYDPVPAWLWCMKELPHAD